MKIEKRYVETTKTVTTTEPRFVLELTEAELGVITSGFGCSNYDQRMKSDGSKLRGNGISMGEQTDLYMQLTDTLGW